MYLTGYTFFSIALFLPGRYNSCSLRHICLPIVERKQKQTTPPHEQLLIFFGDIARKECTSNVV